MKAMAATDMKQMNRKVVFDIVRKKRSITRVELCEMTGMSGPSIMTIVNEFIEKGILTVTGKKNGSVGRNPVTMVFNPDVMQSVGIEFEGNNLSVGLVNLDGEISFQTMVKAPSSLSQNFYQSLYKSIDKLEGMLRKRGMSYHGIGFGIPGAVSPEEKIIYFAPYVGVFEPVDISEDIVAISRRYNKPVFIENDVNASAIGEYYVRRRKEDAPDLLYISVGAGIGAGIILDGQLRHGRKNLCGEIGYSLRDLTGTVSRSQTGWLESSISYETLCEKYEDYRKDGTVSRDMIDYVTEIICPFIANLVNTLDIDLVVFGGDLAVSGGAALLEAVRSRVQRLSLSDVTVQGCETEYTGVVGSALLASDQLWDTIL